MATLTRRCCGFSHFPTRCCNCLKTAEISALFQQCIHLMDFGVGLAVFHQSAVFVWKWPKFRPFSNNVSVWIICPLFRLFSNNFSPSSLGFLGKRPKFRPFSYNMLLLFENSRNFGRFPTTLNVSAVFQQLCFGRFPTTVFGCFPTNFRAFYS